MRNYKTIDGTLNDHVVQQITTHCENSLTSAESGFCQRVSHVLRSVSSPSTAPAVTGVLCPDVPGGRLLIAGLCCAFAGWSPL
jgi:hypothetical protein